MTRLRQMMLEELQRRNYSQLTIESYLHAVEDFARYFGQSPDQLNQEHIRQYHLHLVQDRKFAVNTIVARIAALRFFFVKTLRRPYQREDLPSPKRPKRLPSVLSQEEVARLIDAAANLFHYTILMTLYATGLRRAELCRLRVSDIDSQRMVIHIHQGKGNRDRDVPLTPKLLDTLRTYWRWKKPKDWLFPSRGIPNAVQPISTKAVYFVVQPAAKRAELDKPISPHTLRHSWATHLLENGILSSGADHKCRDFRFPRGAQKANGSSNLPAFVVFVSSAILPSVAGVAFPHYEDLPARAFKCLKVFPVPFLVSAQLAFWGSCKLRQLQNRLQREEIL